MPHALHAGAEDEQDHQRKVHGQIHVQIQVPVADRGRRDLVRAHKQVLVCAPDRQEHAGAAEDQIHDEPDQETLDRSAPDPVLSARAQILRVEADDRGAERIHRAHQEVVELVGRAEAVLRGVSGRHDAVRPDVEADERALHHDDADRQHRKLKSHRQSLTQVLRIHGELRAKILSGEVELRIFAEGVDQAQERAHRLRQHGGSRRADDPEPERKDEQQVEPDVQHGGKQQEDERRGRIAQTAQNGADQIVVELREDPEENDQRILICRPPDAGVCLGQADEPEQGLERQHGDTGQRERQDTAENELRRKGSADSGLIAAPRRDGRDDRKSGGAADRELQEDEQDRKHIVHARNVIDAERLPADRSIADRIDLLQQIRENDRYGKLENHPSFVAGKQVDRRFFPQL